MIDHSLGRSYNPEYGTHLMVRLGLIYPGIRIIGRSEFMDTPIMRRISTQRIHFQRI